MSTRPITRLSRRQKIAAAAVASALGALSALGGTYAAFTATDSTPPQIIESGTVDIAFQGGTFTAPIANTSPGDVTERTITLENTGAIAYSTVTLSQVNLGTLLTSDPLGYSVAVFDTMGTPAVTTDDAIVLAETKFSAFDPLVPEVLNLAPDRMVAGAITNLRFVYTFNGLAPNTFKALSDSVTFTVNATQRAAGVFVETSPSGSLTGH